MTKLCKKCGKLMTNIYRHHDRNNKKRVRKIINEIINSKGDAEFDIKSGHWYYNIWYCPQCDTISETK